MCSNYSTIIIIILGAGVLGGVTNFLLSINLKLKFKENSIKLLGSILLSLCASLTVPLFLQILSNNLLDNLTFKNSLIFAGFCVLASFFSKRFLQDVYSKLKSLEQKVDDQGEETKKEFHDQNVKTESVNKKVEDIEESLEEVPDDLDNPIPTEIKESILKANKALTDNEAALIVNALFTSKYLMRTPGGIAKETQVDPVKIETALKNLRDLGFASWKVGLNGKDYWRVLKYPIKIYSATFGVPGSVVDVTDFLQSQVSKGITGGPISHLYFQIPDPKYGAIKTLNIHCRIHGHEKKLAFSESQGSFKIA